MALQYPLFATTPTSHHTDYRRDLNHAARGVGFSWQILVQAGDVASQNVVKRSCLSLRPKDGMCSSSSIP
jgi:hypothetical protein